MKIRCHFYHLYLLILCCLLLSIGCTTSTKPNTPYSGAYPAAFNNLAKENPLLARELGKIPEIQDGISETDATALERIGVFYYQNQNHFNSAFECMNDVGYTNVRKFCTPLQALYWLALDDKLNQIDVSNYTLIELLNQAWYKSGFEYDGTGRWDDFNDVTERLNSPELVDYYVSRNFTYKRLRLESTHDYRNPYIIFIKKQGACWLYTAFSVYCFKKAGYQAHAVTVFHGVSSKPNHVACEYIDKTGKEYILDNSITVHGLGHGLGYGIYEKKAYLDIYPYYGKGYLTE
jgi:hypothetical protein